MTMQTAEQIIVDSFAGGGGASLGIQWALGRGPDIAINHDHESIELHKANHPHTKHYNEDVWKVDPIDACAGRKVGLMWLSPDCKHFSKAKGGKPVSPRVRGLAWVAIRWASAVKPTVIVLENVEEFRTWGPVLYGSNKPCPRRKGQTYRAFKRELEREGYEVEDRELRASNYNTPTIRKRLFLIARCDGQPIVWPKPTHGFDGAPVRTAAECIDWSIPCPSIFERKKKLAINTEKRIARGIKRFVIDSPRPFIVHFKSGAPSSVGEPMPTQTSRDCFGVAVPYIAGVGGRQGQSPERSVSQPFQTITAKGDSAVVVPHITKFRGGATGSRMEQPMPTVTANGFEKRPGGAAPLGLVTPVIVPTAHQGDERAHSVEEPLRTITGSRRGDHAVVAPHLVTYHGNHEGEDRARGSELEAPLPTQDTSNRFGLVTPVLVGAGGPARHGEPRSVEEPMHAILARSHDHLVAPHLVQRYGERAGQLPRTNSVEEPMNTVVPTGNGADLVEAFLAKHNGGHEATGQELAEPVHAVTSRDQKALVTSHLTSFYTSNTRGGEGDLRKPLKTITAGGNHIAEVRAFLMSYYSGGQAKGDLFHPMGSVTPTDRFGLVTVHGVEYVIADIGMRMLAPRELYRAQGFPDSYKIDIPYTREVRSKKTGKVRRVTKPMTKTAQVRMVGNSVCPPLAEAIIRANCGWLMATREERAA